ncbi:MAG TPA: protocatechuate 3,4-dioxygenase subunit alpha [Solirubrobacteraceae bacterium]
MIFATTPSQTVGPYFTIGLPWDDARYAVSPGTPGAITISGVLSDGAGDPIPDGLIETWQPDSEGCFADLHGSGGGSESDGFRGFARAATDDDGRYQIVTVKPGAVSGPGDEPQAPHIDVSVFARGLLHRCVTRIYFADEQGSNARDPVLNTVPSARRETLLAQPAGDGYQFDIRLQGAGETVFFDL